MAWMVIQECLLLNSLLLDHIWYKLQALNRFKSYGVAVIKLKSNNYVESWMKSATFNIKKNTSVLLRTVVLIWLTSLAFICGNTLAATPDGVTPANEGVCNVLQASGITPGLYGLCVAYCEAQDLDTFDKEPPSTKILANYNKRKQASDPTMPCRA